MNHKFRINIGPFGIPTDRQQLEDENTEYDYGHNIKHHPEE